MMKLGIPELKSLHCVERQADNRGPYVRRPVLFKCRLVDKRSMVVLCKLSGTGHRDCLAMCGRSAAIDGEADLGAGCIARDVVVVRHPDQDLIPGDSVGNHYRAMAAA